ncbi:MAG TPA: hypothetical protein VH639_03790 [Bryobacteraceae bacterium]|jgi:hypothetical protein
MVSATNGAQPGAGAGLLFSGITSAGSIDSFAQQLAATLEQYLGQSANGSGIQLNIQPQSSQNSGDGQFLVTATTQPVAAADPHQVSLGSAPQDSPPDAYVSVPFGSGTSIVPTLATVLARENAAQAMMSPAAILNQDAVTLAGDPMSGVSIPGTNMKWDDLTQDQQLAYEYALNYGMPSGQSMQDYLNANLGPQTMANAPCSNPTKFGNS